MTMKTMIPQALALLLLAGCAAEKTTQAPVSDSAASTAPSTVASATTDTATSTASATTATMADDSVTPGTWAGQVKVADPVSMFNYVGAESGDFAPMRFRNDSAAGKKILAVCANDGECEFTGSVRWLDEAPPENASAIGEIVSVDTVRKLPPPK
jgi:hypothetical protein